MRLEAFIEYGGTEIANAARTLAYLERGLAGSKIIAEVDAGSCEAMGTGYFSPAADPAPWYDSTRPESGTFLGVFANDIRLTEVSRRVITDRDSVGAVIGRTRLTHRLVQVKATLYASTAAGMFYGERWLAGELTRWGRSGQADLLVLPACPDGEDPTAFRTLYDVGLVALEPPGPIVRDECTVQEVAFQLAAGNPFLHYPAESCLAQTVVVGS